MGSSFSRKSNSSASKAPKPTYRRASAAGKGAAPTRSAATVKPSTPSKRAVSPGGASRPAAKVRPAAKPAGIPPSKVKQMKRRAVSDKPAAKPALKAKSPMGGLPKPSAKIPAVKAPVAPASKTTPAKTSAAKSAASSALSTVGNAIGAVSSRVPIPKVSPVKAFIASGVVLALVLVGFIIANSALFAATDIQVRGSDHVEAETARALVEVPEGTTLFNVDEQAILDSLEAVPWVKGVKIEREWPHTLIVTPVEREMRAIAYITADEIAWGIGEDGTWIAPLSLVVAVDAEGNEVALNDDGSVPDGAAQLSPFDAALRLAQDSGSLLLTDVPSDVSPKGGEAVSAKVILAGLEYANTFTADFLAQIKDISVASVEAISADLVSGVEVSLGKPENITEKERVVTKLLSEQQGVTYINVREPGAYTFRSAPL